LLSHNWSIDQFVLKEISQDMVADCPPSVRARRD